MYQQKELSICEYWMIRSFCCKLELQKRKNLGLQAKSTKLAADDNCLWHCPLESCGIQCCHCVQNLFILINFFGMQPFQITSWSTQSPVLNFFLDDPLPLKILVLIPLILPSFQQEETRYLKSNALWNLLQNHTHKYDFS